MVVFQKRGTPIKTPIKTSWVHEALGLGAEACRSGFLWCLCSALKQELLYEGYESVWSSGLGFRAYAFEGIANDDSLHLLLQQPAVGVRGAMAADQLQQDTSLLPDGYQPSWIISVRFTNSTRSALPVLCS